MTRRTIIDEEKHNKFSGWLEKVKAMLYESTFAHLLENENNSSVAYYSMEVIQTLSFLWFFVHPFLNIYTADQFLVPQLHFILKAVNFYQILIESPEIYSFMVIMTLGFASLVNILCCFSSKCILSNNQSTISIYLKKIVNFLFIFISKAFSGPYLGLIVTILYCQPQSPYHLTRECYSNKELIYCILAGILLLNETFNILYCSLFYYIKNPFSDSYLGYPNRHYMLSKSLFKLLFPIFFAVNYSLHLQFMFITVAPILWGLYMFYHRLFSLHSYKHQHFYVEFFCEGFLFWMGVSSFLTYCFNGSSNKEFLNLVYNLIFSVLMSFVLLNVQKRYHYKWMEQNLQGRVKKQNIQKFLIGLISEMMHVPQQEGNIAYKVYSNIIKSNLINLKLKETKCRQKVNGKNGKEQKKQVFQFLLSLVDQYISDIGHKQMLVNIIRCQLLNQLEFYYFSLYEVQEIKGQKLSMPEEFALYGLTKSYRRSDDNFLANSTELAKMFYYQKQFSELDELMSQCANNNSQYWEELIQIQPSMPKVRALAARYIQYSEDIQKSYRKIKAVLPLSKLPTFNYLQFLTQVGTDLRATAKIRDELNAIITNYQNNGKQIGGISGDDVAMVAAGTAKNNFGIVINCSTIIKNVLGFTRENLIGKNITKLMPQVYAELHNTFLLKFIKGHQSTSIQSSFSDNSSTNSILSLEKVVNALSFDGYLVQIGIIYETIISSESELIMASFLRKKSTEGGLMMIEANTGEVLGIDKKFYYLIKQTLRGKQLSKQQLNLSVLMPELDLKLLEREEVQNSFLELANSQSDKNHLLDVVVELRQNKTYQDKKLFSLEIFPDKIDIKNDSQIVINAKNSLNRFQLTVKRQNFRNQETESLKNIQSLNAIKGLKENDHDQRLLKSLPLTIGMDAFIRKNEKKTFKLVLLLFEIFIFISLGTYSIVMFEVGLDKSEKAEKMYYQMRVISDISFQQAQINLNANKVWCYEDHEEHMSKSNTELPKIKQAADILATSLQKILEGTTYRNYPLVYNQNRRKEFIFGQIVGQNLQKYSRQLNIIDGISNYILSARSLAAPQFFSNQQAPNKFFISQQVVYITFNGDKILPAIADYATEAYERYFNEQIEDSIILNFILKSASILLCIILLVGTIILSNSLKHQQDSIFEFYKKLRLWDISQLSNKCQHFLQTRGVQPKKPRKSSLLRIFPAQTIADIIQNQKNNEVASKANRCQNFSKTNQKVGQCNKSQQKNEAEASEDEENVLLQKQSFNVHLYEDKDKSSFLLLFFVSSFLFVAIVILSFSMFNYLQLSSDLREKLQLIKNVGMLKKSMTYLDLFAYRIADKEPDYDYAALVGSQVQKFYKYSALTYTRLGNQIFKSVYGHVQNLERFFVQEPSAVDHSILQRIYSKASAQLSLACQKITEIDQTIFRPQFEGHINYDETLDMILTFLLWLVSFIFALLMRLVYFSPLYLKRVQETNMLKILPIWVVSRSAQAKAYLFKQ